MGHYVTILFCTYYICEIVQSAHGVFKLLIKRYDVKKKYGNGVHNERLLDPFRSVNGMSGMWGWRCNKHTCDLLLSELISLQIHGMIQIKKNSERQNDE